MSQFEPAAPSNAGPLTGSLLANRYELGALLGKGGMGHVYAARDRKLQREVAVKLLGSASPDRDAMRRFSREALATGSLQHPNVVAVFDAGEEQGRPYLVTELLRGGTLRALLDRGPMQAAQALAYARQVAAGLAAAHDKGFTHRDLKPENVFITDDNWLKILDFGLVKLTESLHVSPPPGADGSTGVGRTLGTIGYMAPEQVRGQPVDPRADLFNFGLVFYEMLAGDRAFKGNSSTETSYAILFRQPPPLPKPVPQAVRRLIDRCLQKDRENRPASARELLTSLRELESSGARRGLRLPRFWPALLLVPAAIGAAFLGHRWWVARKPEQKIVSVPANVAPPVGAVAIFPFSSRDAPHFAALAEGVGDLLQRDFEGQALRAVEPASVMNAVGGAEISDIDRARAAAAQLGARYFVLGRIEERKGGRLQVLAVLHSTDTAETVSEASAQDDPSQLLRLIRNLSDRLQLRPLTPEVFAARLARLTLETTDSPEALQAWLEGEHLLRGSHREGSDGAAKAFQRAALADREFALAHYRLGAVALLSNPGLSEDELEIALRNGDRLKPPEREIAKALLAMQHGAYEETERILTAATVKYADESEVWLQLGDFYFHQGPIRGHPPQEALNALIQVRSLDPLNVEATEHLAELAKLHKDRALVAKYADRLTGLTDDPLLVAYSRMERAWGRGDIVEHYELMASFRAPGFNQPLLQPLFNCAVWQMDDLADAEKIAALIPGNDRLRPQASLALLRGQPDAARLVFAPFNSGDEAFYLAWIDTLDAFAISQDQLRTARAAAERLARSDSTNPSLSAALRYAIGMLAWRDHDTKAVEAAARDLEKMPPIGASSITADLALSLRARILAGKGQTAAALALLDRERLIIPLRLNNRYFNGRAEHNFFRASLLAKLGRPAEALALYDAITFYSYFDPTFAPVAHLRKAEIYDAQKDYARAIEHYAAFAEMWKNCEPMQRSQLEHARKRLGELQALH